MSAEVAARVLVAAKEGRWQLYRQLDAHLTEPSDAQLAREAKLAGKFALAVRVYLKEKAKS